MTLYKKIEYSVIGTILILIITLAVLFVILQEETPNCNCSEIKEGEWGVVDENAAPDGSAEAWTQIFNQCEKVATNDEEFNRCINI